MIFFLEPLGSRGARVARRERPSQIAKWLAPFISAKVLEQAANCFASNCALSQCPFAHFATSATLVGLPAVALPTTSSLSLSPASSIQPPFGFRPIFSDNQPSKS